MKIDEIDEESSKALSSKTELDSDETKKEEARITTTLLVVAMTSISQPHTLKLCYHIKNTKVMVLVDSGSTHKFIDSRVEKQLNIFIYPTIIFQVSIPGNKTTPCDGKCHKVELDIKNYKLRSPKYAMKIKGVGIVLRA